MNFRAKQYARKVQELVAENEGLSLNDVLVTIEYDGDYMEPRITMDHEAGFLTAKLHDGESYGDLDWQYSDGWHK